MAHCISSLVSEHCAFISKGIRETHSANCRLAALLLDGSDRSPKIQWGWGREGGGAVDNEAPRIGVHVQ